tara:strand:- start:414 stop:890 length:477 start_codon:yes stop_codon:yes gene_type:complete
MKHNFLIVFTILLGNLFSDVLIKTGDKDFILKAGDIFSINSDQKKYTFETFDINLINNQIDVNLINSIKIYKSKNLAGPLFKNILISGLILSGVFAISFQDTWLFEKPEIFLIGGGITFGLSTLGGMIGKFLKADTTIKIKNTECTTQEPCTEWIILN